MQRTAEAEAKKVKRESERSEKEKKNKELLEARLHKDCCPKCSRCIRARWTGLAS